MLKMLMTTTMLVTSVYYAYADDTSPPVNPTMDMITTLEVSTYNIVKTCADNKLMYNEDQANMILDALKADLDKRQISQESRDVVWNQVSKISIHTHDCETVGPYIVEFFPNLNINGKSPF